MSDHISLKNACHFVDLRSDETCADIMPSCSMDTGYYHFQNPRFYFHHGMTVPEIIRKQREGMKERVNNE